MTSTQEPKLGGSASTLAGIVTYQPDEEQLAKLVAAIAPDMREVVIYANSEMDEAAEGRLAAAAGSTAFTVLRPGGNLGLGAAYNAFVALAKSHGDGFLFLLDQDSMPSPATVPRLVDLYLRLVEAGERPAVVGPCPLGTDGAPMKLTPRPGPAPIAEAVRSEFVISSGSLLACANIEAVGPFRADFFIDAIDIEWCMRANHRGHSIWVAKNVGMDHVLGRGLIRLPFGLLLTDQPPRRLYTFIRNQLAMLRMPHVPKPHKAKTILAMPLRILVYLVHNRFSRGTWVAIWKGLVDGMSNRLGVPGWVCGTWRA